jgi:hypothetical protein
LILFSANFLAQVITITRHRAFEKPQPSAVNGSAFSRIQTVLQLIANLEIDFISSGNTHVGGGAHM